MATSAENSSSAQREVDGADATAPANELGTEQASNADAVDEAGVVDGDFAASSSSSDSEGESDDEQGHATSSKRNEDEDVGAEELEALRREQEEQLAEAGQGGRSIEELGRGQRSKKSAPSASEDTRHAQTLSTEEQHAKEEAEQAAWKAFQEADASSSTAAAALQEGDAMVKVVERYRFAGRDVVKERLLPSSHPDAVAYLKKTGGLDRPLIPDVKPPSSLSENGSTSTVSSPTPTSSKPPPLGPAAGRKKRSSKLAGLAASANPNAGKKMNTLEKSKMDWDGWKQQAAASQSQKELDDMEQQTRTGSGVSGNSMSGYLGRKDFLDRVRDRTGQ